MSFGVGLALVIVFALVMGWAAINLDNRLIARGEYDHTKPDRRNPEMFKVSKQQIATLLAAPVALAITVGSAWVTKHFPGVKAVDSTEAHVVGGAVGLFAATTILHWLKGNREWERLKAEGELEVDEEDEQPLADVPPNDARGDRSAAEAALAGLPEPDAPPAIEGGAPGGGE